jgi:hypothetical protein
MTGTVTDEDFYNEHAALLGHVTLAWNDCHSVVLEIFHTLSGGSWEAASSTFLALNSDYERRKITLERMNGILDTYNDQAISELGTQLLSQLRSLAGERNLATHTMWVAVMPQREIRPHPGLPQPKSLNADFKAQFSKLTTGLRGLFRELMRYDAALRVHLEQRNGHPPATAK